MAGTLKLIPTDKTKETTERLIEAARFLSTRAQWTRVSELTDMEEILTELARRQAKEALHEDYSQR